MIIAEFAAVVLIGYLLGSIPFGVIIGRRSAKVDIREIGSGKTGATNVLRVAGKKAAALVLILDLLKGLLAVVFAGLIFNGDYLVVGGSGLWGLVRSAQVLAALAAIAGHKWPVFLKFKGGRGVATFFGGLLALCPPAALFGVGVLLITAFITKYVSLGSIAGAVSTYAILVPLTIINGFPIEYLVYTLIGAIFIIVVHRDNIVRLISGTERKLGEKVKVGGSLPSTNP
ncbi:MAG: glycerol-3-phosphate acyltransferase [Dehalococcoidia bacterium]|nr:MAG: glycerol-3-phosphate acyltransferase [Dehalococcoidia bacterium]